MFLEQILKNIKNNPKKDFLIVNKDNKDKIYTYEDLKIRLIIMT